MSAAFPPPPADQPDVAEPRRPRVAWVPAIAMAWVAATPLLHLWLFDNLTLRELARDFGLKPGPASQRTFDFLMWYGPGLGWVWTALAIGALAVALPRAGRWASPTRVQSVTIWLLAAACASLVLLLVLAQTQNGMDEFRRLMTGITSGGSRAPTVGR